MPLAVDMLLDRILGDILIVSEILIDYIIKCIIYCRVVSNDGSKLLKNPILL